MPKWKIATIVPFGKSHESNFRSISSGIIPYHRERTVSGENDMGGWEAHDQNADCTGNLTRRDLLRRATLTVAATQAIPAAGWSERFGRIFLSKQKEFKEPERIAYPGSDDALLDEIERAAFDFFWTEAGS